LENCGIRRIRIRIEEEQTKEWSKEKGQKDKQQSINDL
jgi:hypothetical protein